MGNGIHAGRCIDFLRATVEEARIINRKFRIVMFCVDPKFPFLIRVNKDGVRSHITASARSCWQRHHGQRRCHHFAKTTVLQPLAMVCRQRGQPLGQVHRAAAADANHAIQNHALDI